MAFTVAVDLPELIQESLRESARVRGVSVAQEIADRLAVSLSDVSPSALSYRIAGADEDE